MNNFRNIDEKEQCEVWDKFYNLFNFKPSTTIFPGISTSRPELKFDIENCYSKVYPFVQLEQWALKLFRNITKPTERLYALDWHHQCYDFDPRQKMEKDKFDEWIVPVFPNGDYYIFLTKDFKNVWFGHPWEKTITLIGQEIVKYGTEMRIDFENLKW
jgi:hypothetical protein